MNWLEISVNALSGNADSLCDLLNDMGFEELVIEDGSEFEAFLENNRSRWDYVDEAFRAHMRDLCRVKFYVSDDDDGKARLKVAEEGLAAKGYEPIVTPVKDEDWESNWQQYYRPFEIGERLLVVPEWEKIPEGTQRAVLRLNPGLIFGTGSHPTTRMCLLEIEKTVKEDVNVLDLGCGSGILSIGALVLGAKSAFGCDIDEKAPDTAMKNADLSGVNDGRFSAAAGDALSDNALRKEISEKKYELILANIVADVIIKLTPDMPAWLTPDGFFVCSGIIEGRQDEVKKAIKESGLRIIETRHEDDWYAFTSCLPCSE